MELHSEKTLRFARTALKNHISALAVEKGIKESAARATIAKSIGVDPSSVRQFCKREIRKPVLKTMQKYVDWLAANPEKVEKPSLSSIDKFTVTMSKNQFTLLMDILQRDLSDIDHVMRISENDPAFHGYPSVVLLQGCSSIQSLYNDLKRQTGTSWDFDVATQKLFISEEGTL
tara:strand:+ start:228 stop:749 length:522 start_codon:yes stop_codon:yes gene_type:complete